MSSTQVFVAAPSHHVAHAHPYRNGQQGSSSSDPHVMILASSPLLVQPKGAGWSKIPSREWLLMDSGATHQVMYVPNRLIPKNAKTTSVNLAVGTSKCWIHEQVVYVPTKEGDEQCGRVLLPLGRFVQNYQLKLSWKENKAIMTTRTGRKLRILERNGMLYLHFTEMARLNKEKSESPTLAPVGPEVISSTAAEPASQAEAAPLRIKPARLSKQPSSEDHEKRMAEHVKAGHKPVQSWCDVCNRAGGNQKPHLRQKIPHAGGILSVDLMGPYTPAYSPQHLEKPAVKYALVGAFLPPSKPELVVRSMLEQHAKLEALTSDLWRINQEEHDPTQDLRESVPQEPIRTDEKGAPVSQYFVEFVTSKGQQDTLVALQRMFCRIEARYSGAHVIWRLHGDRAMELTGNMISAWANSRGVHVTRVVAKSPSTNGIVERAIGILKQDARRLLLSLPITPVNTLWPFAVLRAATLQRLRRMMKTPLGIPFGAQVVVLKREDKVGETMWDAQTEAAVALGQDPDSRGGGYFVWNVARGRVQIHRNLKEVSVPITAEPRPEVNDPDVFAETPEVPEHPEENEFPQGGATNDTGATNTRTGGASHSDRSLDRNT